MNAVLPVTSNALPVGYMSGVEGAVPLRSTHMAAATEASFNLPADIQMPPSEATIQSTSASTAVNEPSSWGHMVQRMVTDVNDAQATAAAKIQDVLSGGSTPVHDAMISMQEASVKMEFLTQVRNKTLDAYQEIMRMQV